MNFRAMLFDYDGITADTPRLNFQSWFHAFASSGVKLQGEEYFSLEGRGPLNIAQILCRSHGVDLAKAESLMRLKEEHFRSLGQPRIYPQILKLLEILNSRGIPFGLVSGAGRTRIERDLTESLRNAYGAIITSDDTEFTKPHPEPYRKAAEVLGIPPRDTLVIENAPLGILSAKAGGFPCVAIATTLEPRFLTGADWTLPNHDAFLNWLGVEAEVVVHRQNKA